jgi:hypothetical protein
MKRTRLAMALPLAALVLLTGAADPYAGDRREAQVARFTPGAALEVVAAQAELLAMPPAVLRNAQGRLQNRIGQLQRGARVKAVSESEVFCRVAIECQDGRIRIEGWIEKDALRTAAAEPPQSIPR